MNERVRVFRKIRFNDVTEKCTIKIKKISKVRQNMLVAITLNGLKTTVFVSYTTSII